MVNFIYSLGNFPVGASRKIGYSPGKIPGRYLSFTVPTGKIPSRIYVNYRGNSQ